MSLSSISLRPAFSMKEHPAEDVGSTFNWYRSLLVISVIAVTAIETAVLVYVENQLTYQGPKDICRHTALVLGSVNLVGIIIFLRSTGNCLRINSQQSSPDTSIYA